MGLIVNFFWPDSSESNLLTEVNPSQAVLIHPSGCNLFITTPSISILHLHLFVSFQSSSSLTHSLTHFHSLLLICSLTLTPFASLSLPTVTLLLRILNTQPFMLKFSLSLSYFYSLILLFVFSFLDSHFSLARSYLSLFSYSLILNFLSIKPMMVNVSCDWQLSRNL